MKSFVSFGSIGQFRNAIKHVRYTGENPIIQAHGTVKLHGTNASVCFSKQDGLWAQSRNNIITVENDNAGFARFVEDRKDVFETMLTTGGDDTVTIFGEWCGGNIQKGVAINQLDKMFVIFALKCGDVWLNHTPYRYPAKGVYNIDDFPTFDIDINFERPELAQNEIVKMVEQVETECPVAKHFGVSGVGEGIVFTLICRGETLRFKAKGEKHSVSKVTKIAEVDTEKLDSIHKFVEYAVTENRMEQGYDEVEASDMEHTGKFLSWIVKDIIKEESDTLADSGLEQKEVNKYISTKARIWFFARINKDIK